MWNLGKTPTSNWEKKGLPCYYNAPNSGIEGQSQEELDGWEANQAFENEMDPCDSSEYEPQSQAEDESWETDDDEKDEKEVVVGVDPCYSKPSEYEPQSQAEDESWETDDDEKDEKEVVVGVDPCYSKPSEYEPQSQAEDESWETDDDEKDEKEVVVGVDPCYSKPSEYDPQSQEVIDFQDDLSTEDNVEEREAPYVVHAFTKSADRCLEITRLSWGTFDRLLSIKHANPGRSTSLFQFY